MAGLTLDSGALIGFERQDRSVLAHLKAALLSGTEVTIPAVAMAEVWRGGPRSARLARLSLGCRIDPIEGSLAREAGEALARHRRADTIDALVMTSAGRRNDVVLTSDLDDLERLRPSFPGVRLVRV